MEISRRSLFAYQQALNVTSHNISNAENPNYARQKVVFKAGLSEGSGTNYSGSGADIGSIQRIKDQIVESNIRQYTSRFNFSDKKSTVLQSIESIVNEPSDVGLGNLINNFFNSWDELAVNPTSYPARTNVVQSADKLSNKLKNLTDGLNDIKRETRVEAKSLVDEINGYVVKINELNKQIYDSTVRNTPTNDLIDERDAIVIELSKITNVSVTTGENNVAGITIGGVFATDANYYQTFELKEDAGSLYISTANGTERMAVNGGKAAALLDGYNQTVPKYLQELNNIGFEIFSQVNHLHEQGYTLHSTPATNIKFFSSYSDGLLTINNDIIEDAKFIAASSDGNGLNNSIAGQIGAIKNLKTLGGFSISESYANMVSALGNEISITNQSSDAYGVSLANLEGQKQSISGVSLDEEMVNLLSFQRAYDASARLIKIADEMLQTVLQLV
ncbi:Flagellar hook-associated protein 1 [Candidatus Brocadiaceae bacterium]|nr:Flagellar hook-associated protein 1 [Candidatus Brocadiaceae bacterium]